MPARFQAAAPQDDMQRQRQAMADQSGRMAAAPGGAPPPVSAQGAAMRARQAPPMAMPMQQQRQAPPGLGMAGMAAGMPSRSLQGLRPMPQLNPQPDLPRAPMGAPMGSPGPMGFGNPAPRPQLNPQPDLPVRMPAAAPLGQQQSSLAGLMNPRAMRR